MFLQHPFSFNGINWLNHKFSAQHSGLGWIWIMWLIKWVVATFEVLSVNSVMVHYVAVPFNWFVEYLHPYISIVERKTNVEVYKLQFDSRVGLLGGPNVAVVLQRGLKITNYWLLAIWRQWIHQKGWTKVHFTALLGHRFHSQWKFIRKMYFDIRFESQVWIICILQLRWVTVFIQSMKIHKKYVFWY